MRDRATRASDENEPARSQVCDRLRLLGHIQTRTAAAGALEEIVDIVSVADDIAERCNPIALESCVVLRREAPAHAYIRGNRTLLVEAILNLIENAIRYTAPGGMVRLSVRDDESECSVCVEDNVPGVPENVPENEPKLIFESFYQPIAESTALTPGGLALAVVRTIVQAHAGRIEVAASSGQSTAFTLIFPALLSNP